MAGAAEKLGAAFWVGWSKGFAMDESQKGPLIFKRETGALADHPITTGRHEGWVTGGGKNMECGGLPPL